MAIAAYYGENSLIDYTEYYEWVEAIKEDFRKFKSYILVNYKDNTRLQLFLQSLEEGLENIRPYNKKHVDGFNVGQKYTFVSHPVYYDGGWQSDWAIISCNYRLFIFVSERKNKATLFEIKNNEVSENELPYVIPMSWSEENVEMNINCLKSLKKSMVTLGGFAEDQTAVDVDYRYFNCTLAKEYLTAMKDEDFDALGEMDSSLFDTIAFWLNAEEYHKEYHETIPVGNFMTNKGRLFSEAVIEEKQGDLARSLIYNGSTNPSLFATAMVYGGYQSNYFEQAKKLIPAADKYNSFIGEVLESINNIYLSTQTDKQDELIQKIKPFFRVIEVFDNLKSLNCVQKYPWLNSILGYTEKKRSLEQ